MTKTKILYDELKIGDSISIATEFPGASVSIKIINLFGDSIDSPALNGYRHSALGVSGDMLLLLVFERAYSSSLQLFEVHHLADLSTIDWIGKRV